MVFLSRSNMPYRLTYPDKNRTQYIGGKKVDQPDYSQPYVTLLENGYVCTCGDFLKHISGVHSHRRSISHLQKTKQISELNPGSLKQQRDDLITNRVKIW